jgi:hypothetical protein
LVASCEAVFLLAVSVLFDWQVVEVLPGVTWVSTLPDESVSTTVIFTRTASAAKVAVQLPDIARRNSTTAMFFKRAFRANPSLIARTGYSQQCPPYHCELTTGI